MWYTNDISFDRKVPVLLGETGEVIFNLCIWPNTKSYEPDSSIWTFDMLCDYSSASAGTGFIIFLSLASYRQLLHPLLPWKIQTPCCPDQPAESPAWDGTDLNSSLPELWASCNHRGSSCVVSVHCLGQKAWVWLSLIIWNITSPHCYDAISAHYICSTNFYV